MQYIYLYMVRVFLETKMVQVWLEKVTQIVVGGVYQWSRWSSKYEQRIQEDSRERPDALKGEPSGSSWSHARLPEAQDEPKMV